MSNQPTQLFDMPLMREDDLPDIENPLHPPFLQCRACSGTSFHRAEFVHFVGALLNEQGQIAGGEETVWRIAFRCDSCNRVYDRAD